MQKLIAFRFTLPAIIFLAILTIAIIVLALTTHAYHGAAYFPPCC